MGSRTDPVRRSLDRFVVRPIKTLLRHIYTPILIKFNHLKLLSFNGGYYTHPEQVSRLPSLSCFLSRDPFYFETNVFWEPALVVVIEKTQGSNCRMGLLKNE